MSRTCSLKSQRYSDYWIGSIHQFTSNPGTHFNAAFFEGDMEAIVPVAGSNQTTNKASTSLAILQHSVKIAGRRNGAGSPKGCRPLLQGHYIWSSIALITRNDSSSSTPVIRLSSPIVCRRSSRLQRSVSNKTTREVWGEWGKALVFCVGVLSAAVTTGCILHVHRLRSGLLFCGPRPRPPVTALHACSLQRAKALPGPGPSARVSRRPAGGDVDRDRDVGRRRH